MRIKVLICSVRGFVPYCEDQAWCRMDEQPKDTCPEYKSRCRTFHAQVFQEVFRSVYWKKRRPKSHHIQIMNYIFFAGSFKKVGDRILWIWNTWLFLKIIKKTINTEILSFKLVTSISKRKRKVKLTQI